MKSPTQTEQLLFGPNGASDVRSPFRLERDLIKRDKWHDRYDSMPPTIREVVDNFNNPDFDPFSYGCSVGIGHNDEVGWFLLGSGQGPFLLWADGDDPFTIEEDPQIRLELDSLGQYEKLKAEAQIILVQFAGCVIQ